MIRVLIVEDEPLIAQAHREYLERLPQFTVHDVVHTDNAAVRVTRVAARSGAPIDLVLLNIGLPDTRDSRSPRHWAHCDRTSTSSPSPRPANSRWCGPRSRAVWRYLERLADDGVLDRQTEYGRAGRPQVRYLLRDRA